MTNVVFPADHGVRRPGVAPHPAPTLDHRAAEGLGRLSDRIDRSAARTAFEAVLRDGPDIPERVVPRRRPRRRSRPTGTRGGAVRGEADEGPEPDFGFSNGRGEVTMPSMRSPAQRAPGRSVEYATQDDVRVLAAELRSLRESMEAELRAQRESVDARFEKVEAELRAQREFMKAEIRGLRESMEAEFRAQRELMEAELRAQRELMEAELRAQRELMEAEFRAQRELIKVLLEGQVQHAARFDRQDARLDALLKWGIGAMVAAMVGFGGLILRLTGDG